MNRVAYIGTLVALALAASWILAFSQFPLLPGVGRVPGSDISEYDPQGLLLVIIGMALVGVILIPRLARGPEARFLTRILVLAICAKVFGSVVRMWMGFDVYGFNDVARYDGRGELIAGYILNGDFDSIQPYLQFGTFFTMFYTGLIYTFIGPTLYGGFLAFGFISFLGSYLYYRAFRIAFPQGDYRLYAYLVFFFPSILYWSNGIGKDALMAFFLGMFSFGAAHLLAQNRVKGLIFAVIGMLGALTIREPVAAILVCGLLGAFLLQKRGIWGNKAIVAKGLVLILGAGMVWFFTPKLLDTIGIQSLSYEAAQEYFDYRQTTTGDITEGTSAFQAPSFSDPLFIPKAYIAVLFRPFPWESHNLQTMVQSFDGGLLLVLMLWRGRNVFKSVVYARSNPYAIYVLLVVFMLVVATISISNFGTLVRQRAMLIPFVLMLPAFIPSFSKQPLPAAPGHDLQPIAVPRPGTA